MKATPGPWKRQHELRDIYASDGAHVACEIGIYSEASSYPICSIDRRGNGEANAQLIAAAPDLLEACKRAQVMIFMLKGNQNDMYNQLSKIIAKADGRDKGND